MRTFELPSVSGSYRWYYVDLAAGDFTAVIIFMIGSIFSSRYSSALSKGATPRQHAAVNFALYERGTRRQWVLSEYQQVELADEGRTLRIGDSTMHTAADGRLEIDVIDTTALWGKPVQLKVELTPEGPGHAPLRLVEGLEHWWQPIAPKARATLTMPGLALEGRAYHDGNHGEVPLGGDLRGWDWVRTHTEDRTSITYRPWRGSRGWQIDVDSASLAVSQPELPPPPSSRTRWGLTVPVSLSGGEAPVLLESSPFYARMESGRNTLAEVADFRRFHSPWIRWMAALRTRVA